MSKQLISDLRPCAHERYGYRVWLEDGKSWVEKYTVEEQSCSTCQGEGYLHRDFSSENRYEPCPTCKGQGSIKREEQHE